MTDDKIIGVFELYLKRLLKEDAEPKEMPDQYKQRTFYDVPTSMVKNHLAFMCETAIGFVEEGRRDKAFRWLGFLQGTMYMLDVYTIDDLKNHSRPDTDDDVPEWQKLGYFDQNDGWG